MMMDMDYYAWYDIFELCDERDLVNLSRTCSPRIYEFLEDYWRLKHLRKGTFIITSFKFKYRLTYISPYRDLISQHCTRLKIGQNDPSFSINEEELHKIFEWFSEEGNQYFAVLQELVIETTKFATTSDFKRIIKFVKSTESIRSVYLDMGFVYNSKQTILGLSLWQRFEKLKWEKYFERMIRRFNVEEEEEDQERRGRRVTVYYYANRTEAEYVEMFGIINSHDTFITFSELID